LPVAEETTKTSGSGLPIAFAVITLVAAAGGGGLAYILPKRATAETVVAAKPDTSGTAKRHGEPSHAGGPDKAKDGPGHAAADTGHGSHGKLDAVTASSAPVGAAMKFKDIAAITTNLAGDKAPWIRLEGGLLYDAAIEADIAVLATRITEDFIAYLRSVNIQQISGGGGLQALVEDLNERARIRSNGKVQHFVISGFIIE
jgi:hypothetical protein